MSSIPHTPDSHPSNTDSHGTGLDGPEWWSLWVLDLDNTWREHLRRHRTDQINEDRDRWERNHGIHTTIILPARQTPSAADLPPRWTERVIVLPDGDES